MTEELKEPLMNFADKLAEAGMMVTDKLIEVAPDVAESILKLVQIKGIFEISYDVIVFGTLSIVIALMVKNWKRLDEWSDNIRSDDGAAVMGVYNFLLILLAVVTFFNFLSIFDFYNWVAAFYPEGAIAIRALEAVGITL